MPSNALYNAETHHDIHASTGSELDNTMAALRQTMRLDPDRAAEVAQVVLAIWQDRALAHAEAEEQTVYMALGASPAYVEQAARLLRDHDLMRAWVDEARREIANVRRVTGAVVLRLEALLLLRARHEADEEALVATAAAAGGFDPARVGTTWAEEVAG